MQTLAERQRAVQQEREAMRQIAATVDGLFQRMLDEMKSVVRASEMQQRRDIIATYTSGASLRATADKHGVSHEHVRTVVIKAGVMRGRGRPRKS